MRAKFKNSDSLAGLTQEPGIDPLLKQDKFKLA